LWGEGFVRPSLSININHLLKNTDQLTTKPFSGTTSDPDVVGELSEERLPGVLCRPLIKSAIMILAKIFAEDRQKPAEEQ